MVKGAETLLVLGWDDLRVGGEGEHTDAPKSSSSLGLVVASLFFY